MGRLNVNRMVRRRQMASLRIGGFSVKRRGNEAQY